MIPVVHRVTPFGTEHRRLEAAVGSTVTDIVELAIPPEFVAFAHVAIGDHTIPPDRWDITRPKPNAPVTVTLVPHGGGSAGKTALRTVAVIAIVVAAAYTGGAASGALAGAGYGTTAATIGGAVAASATGIAGPLALCAMVPPAAAA